LNFNELQFFATTKQTGRALEEGKSPSTMSIFSLCSPGGNTIFGSIEVCPISQCLTNYPAFRCWCISAMAELSAF